MADTKLPIGQRGGSALCAVLLRPDTLPVWRSVETRPRMGGDDPFRESCVAWNVPFVSAVRDDPFGHVLPHGGQYPMKRTRVTISDWSEVDPASVSAAVYTFSFTAVGEVRTGTT